MSRVRVLIADDHPLFRGAISDVINARPDLELVGAAADGRQALERIRELKPDVAVLDMRMPDLDGMKVLNAVRRDDLGTQVLLCAASTESSHIYECIAAGAAGYLDKGCHADEICDGIAAVARGGTVLSDRVEAGVLQQIRLRSDRPAVNLTGRERDVLRSLTEGLSAPEIARQLQVAPSTVRSHLQNLYGKLGVSDRAAAVAVGMRQGLVE